MSESEPTDAAQAVSPAPAAPAPGSPSDSAPAETAPPSSSAKQDRRDASSPGANGKVSKSDTPKDKDKDKEKKNGKDVKEGKEGKEGQVEGKQKREPYVNQERFKTGGVQREKPSPEELAARMERIRLNNEKIKERRAAVQADEQAFRESQVAQRAKEASARRVQSNIDANRAMNAKRKMERMGVREWDNFKKGGPGGPKNEDGGVNAGDNASEVKEGSNAPDQSEDASQVAGEGRGRGRGAGRGRGRGRGARGAGDGGSGRGRGGRGKASIARDAPPHNADEGGWGTGADDWGSATSPGATQTGIAITTNEGDPWGAGGADDPWGTKPVDDPWGSKTGDDPWSSAAVTTENGNGQAEKS